MEAIGGVDQGVAASAWSRFARGPLAPLAVALLVAACQLPIFDRWFSFMDEGHILLFADIIAHGGELYRDATVYPLPGAFYLLAGLFHVFGASNLVARWVMLAEYAVFVALVFVLLRKLVTPAWAFAGVFVMLLYRIWAFPHWHMYSYSTTALLLLLGALLLLLRFTETDDRRWLPAAGLVFGLGVLCKQDYGAAALLASAVVLAVYARTAPPGLGVSFWRLGTWFIAPAVLVGVATVIHFLRQGLLGDFLRLTVLNHFVGMSSYHYTEFPSFLPLFQQDPQLRNEYGRAAYIPGILYEVDLRALRRSWFYRDSSFYDTALKIYYYLPYLVVAVAVARTWVLRHRFEEPDARRRALAELGLTALAGSLLLLVTVNRPQDYVHLAVLYWPILCLLLVHLHDALAPRRALAWALAAVFALPATAAVAYTGRLALRLHSLNSTPIDSPRAGILVEPRHARLLNDMVAWLRQNTEPGEAVAVMPYFPLLQFYADRRGPDRSSYIVWPFPEFPDRDARVIRALDATHTRVLIYNFNQFAVFEDAGAYAADLFRYLVDHFKLLEVHSSDYWGYELGIAVREEGDAPGVALLGEDGDGASLFLRSPLEPPEAISPADADHWLEHTLWPFRHVLALRPSDGRATVLSLPVTPPPGSHLHTAVAVHPSEWDQHPPVSARFELAIVDGDRRSVLFEHTLRPTPRFEDRGWVDVDVPLDAWAGRRVRVELSTETDDPLGEKPELGGWEVPRLVPAPAPGGAPS